MKTPTSNKTIIALSALVLALCFGLTSCEEDQTYANQKKAERRAINTFLNKGVTALDNDLGDTVLHVDPIKVISEEQFAKQDSTTDVSKNEYVLLSSTGVYMQIIRKGNGTKLKDGDNVRVLCRYIEYNIQGDSVQSRNNNAYYIAVPDEMTVQNSSGTLTGTFISGMMYKNYKKSGSSSVPEGWLVPLRYINLGRQNSETDEVAKVRLIVPHSAGQAHAVSNVYPCFYELTFMRGR